MARIHVLSEHAANQIAAGEVVERPASIVKELVENALDAGARAVTVELSGGGRDLVRVTDDGSGMSPEDAALAFERHATSKLADEHGLAEIATLGFRGEALPSIASVARVALVTAERGALEGTRLELEGGRLTKREPAGAAPGTRLEVRDLFFNTPARRKFLKKTETETTHALEAVVRLALAHPEVAFVVKDDARVVWQATPGAGVDGERARVAAALGREIDKHLVRVDYRLGTFHLTGWAAAPTYSAGSARELYTYVNRRFVRDRGLLHAVSRAFADRLAHGRYGAAVLHLDVPLGAVDVNVHPQKLEVRFADARGAYDVTFGGLSRALGTVTSAGPHSVQNVQGVHDVQDVQDVQSPDDDARRARVAEAVARYQPRPDGPRGPYAPQPPRPEQRELLPASPGAARYFARLVYLGQLDRTYLLCEGDGGLVMVDQHAAHEHLRYRELTEAAAPRDSQRLLAPLTLDLAPARALALLAHTEQLAALGFEIEDYGGGTLAVAAIPATLARRDLHDLFAELAADLPEHGRASAADAARHAVLATVACHSSVRAGDLLQPDEARALLSRLDVADSDARCPHGRPVCVELGFTELEKQFGRDYASPRRPIA